MNSGQTIQLVGIDCQPEAEDRFNKWYEEVHIPLLLKFPQLKKVTRFRIPKTAPDYPKYLTMMEFDNRDACEAYNSSAELAAAREDSKQTWGGKGYEIKWRVQYEVLKEWKR
jgi:uncharacterized protein (TIGR02118 family)